MASKFSELFDDFKDLVKVYTENLDVTPLQFMRLLTQGVQIFQRQTEIVERFIELSQTGTPLSFVVPDDLLRVVEIRDWYDKPVVLQEFHQYKRNVDLYTGGYRRTPVDGLVPLVGSKVNDLNDSRLATVWDRRLYMHPWAENVKIAMWYIPDLYPISRNTDMWDLWFTDADAFETQFTTVTLTADLQTYENCLVDFAISKYLKGKGNANQKIYEDSFYSTIQLALANKKTYFHEGGGDYNYGINSIPTVY